MSLVLRRRGKVWVEACLGFGLRVSSSPGLPGAARGRGACDRRRLTVGGCAPIGGSGTCLDLASGFGPGVAPEPPLWLSLI